MSTTFLISQVSQSVCDVRKLDEPELILIMIHEYTSSDDYS